MVVRAMKRNVYYDPWAARAAMEFCVCASDDTCPCIVCHEELDELLEEDDAPIEDDD